MHVATFLDAMKKHIEKEAWKKNIYNRKKEEQNM